MNLVEGAKILSQRFKKEADKVRDQLHDDPYVSNEDYGRLVEEAEDADERELERVTTMFDDIEEEMLVTYKIIRFHFKGGNEVIETGLTLQEAQAHCNRDDTHGDGWFDGYTKEQ